MATRRNLCINPALDVDASGWGGASTPARTDATGLGFTRQWAARYTAGTHLQTSATDVGAVVVGTVYTLSVSIRAASFSGSGNAYIEWLNSGGSGFGYPSASYSATAGTVTRVSITATAPTGAVRGRLILDGVNYSINTVDATTVLIEPAPTLSSYFDGNSPSAAWDGTAGLSSSTLTDSSTPISSGDTGTGTDAATPAAASSTADTAAGADTASPAAAVPATDTGTGSESAAVGLAAQDTAAAADSATLAAAGTAADAAVAAEFASVTVAITTADLAAAADAAHALIPGQDITIRLGASRRSWAARSSRR